jgi:hypothetical protein
MIQATSGAIPPRDGAVRTPFAAVSDCFRITSNAEVDRSLRIRTDKRVPGTSRQHIQDGNAGAGAVIEFGGVTWEADPKPRKKSPATRNSSFP